MRIHLLLLASLLAAVVAACSKPAAVETPLGGFGGFPATGGSGGNGIDCDVDMDGFEGTACGGLDCDDNDPTVYPGAAERCDTPKDDNCDGKVNEGCACVPGTLQDCWPSNFDAARRNKGLCKDGWSQCQIDGTWSDCKDAVGPAAPAITCDNLDHDCDGVVDAQASCNACKGAGKEICGNGLDDDCDGVIDNPEICTLDCSAVNTHDMANAALLCCATSPPDPWESTCDEFDGLPSCTQRKCQPIPGSNRQPGDCVPGCRSSQCVCGLMPPAGQLPIPDPGCGYASPCSLVDCDDRQNQPCYPSKQWWTLGEGICHAGAFSCVNDASGKHWTTCEGAVTPQTEICGNHLDDDCDGAVDESEDGMSCGTTVGCPPDAKEICDNQIDDNCDGFVDEGCPAPAGGTQKCWTGSLLALGQVQNGMSACRTGHQTELNGYWGPCVGEVLPGREICGDNIDSDCNGLGAAGEPEDPFCCVPSAEICNGKDDDCDGVIDNGLLNACGKCDGSSCNEVALDNLSDCSAAGRSCTQIQPFELDPSAITLAQGRATQLSNLLWGAYPGAGMNGPGHVIQIDINSGLITRNITAPLGGHTPVELVTELDGSVWVLYSGFGGRSPTEHFDRLGNLLCVYEDNGLTHMGPDPEKGIWGLISSGGSFYLRRFSGDADASNPYADGKPRCVITDLAPGDGSTTDLKLPEGGQGVAADANHWVWISGTTQMMRVDALDPTAVIPVTLPSGGANAGRLTVGIDDWVITSKPVRAISAPGSQVREIYGGSVNDVVNLPDGTIWVNVPNGAQPDAFLHIDAQTGRGLQNIPLTQSRFGSTGVAIDSNGNVWTAQTGEFDRLNAGTGSVDTFDPGFGIRTVIQSNSTAVPLRDIPLRRGEWAQLLDPGTYEARWQTLDYEAHAPEGTRIVVYVRFADSQSDLGTTKFICGPYEKGHGDLSSCSGGRRYAQLQIMLSGGGGKPSVSNIHLSWTR